MSGCQWQTVAEPKGSKYEQRKTNIHSDGPVWHFTDVHSRTCASIDSSGFVSDKPLLMAMAALKRQAAKHNIRYYRRGGWLKRTFNARNAKPQQFIASAGDGRPSRETNIASSSPSRAQQAMHIQNGARIFYIIYFSFSSKLPVNVTKRLITNRKLEWTKNKRVGNHFIFFFCRQAYAERD